jgi:hypothetical protein
VSWVVHPSDCFLLVRVVHGFGLVLESFRWFRAYRG